MRTNPRFVWPVIVTAVIITAYQIGAALIPNDRAMNAAEVFGYTDVKVTDSTVWFVGARGCSRGDAKRWTVTGTSPAGEQRTFYVCGGLLKGGTVRSK